MGTQQLLLLVLGAVIVGVAIVAGLNMASSGAEQAEREGANVEAQAIGASATAYARKPLQWVEDRVVSQAQLIQWIWISHLPMPQVEPGHGTPIPQPIQFTWI